MSSTGIDYGLGQSNIDRETGIRFGVIAQNSIMPEAIDEFEQDYGEPTCPECGNKALDASNKTLPAESENWDNTDSWGCNDYACPHCEHFLDSSVCFSEESVGFTYQMDGYQLTNCLDSDIFILKSKFYTFAQFCSPCVPGAGNLDNYMPDGVKTYCLGHDWFEDSKAPYPIYSVATETEVLP